MPSEVPSFSPLIFYHSKYEHQKLPLIWTGVARLIAPHPFLLFEKQICWSQWLSVKPAKPERWVQKQFRERQRQDSEGLFLPRAPHY